MISYSNQNSSCIIADIVVQAIGQGRVLCALWSSSASLAITTNALALVATTGNKQFRSAYNYLLASLFTSNLLMAAIVQPLFAVVSLNSYREHTCIIKKIAVYIGGNSFLSSTFFVMGVSFNLYFRIRKPLVVDSPSDKKRWIICIGIVWILSSLTAVTPVFYPKDTPLIPILFLLVLLTTLTFAILLLKLRKTVGVHICGPSRSESSLVYKRRCKKVVITFLTVSVLFIFFPCLSVSLSHSQNITSTLSFKYFHSCVSKLPFIKPLIDPVVYLWFQNAGRNVLNQRMKQIRSIVSSRRSSVDFQIDRGTVETISEDKTSVHANAGLNGFIQRLSVATIGESNGVLARKSSVQSFSSVIYVQSI